MTPTTEADCFDGFHSDECPGCGMLAAERGAEARTAALTALRERVEGLPNTSGGHMDSSWNDVIGATQSWHECHGLSRAAVLAEIDRMLKGA